jgi:hypothetical protein
MLKFKKYRVRRFVPSPVHVLDKFPHGERFVSPYGKNLSPCGKFNDSDAKHKQKSAILPVRELANDKLITLCWMIYGEKNLSPYGNLSGIRTGLGTKRRTLYFLNIEMKSKFLTFKILQRIIRKFPAIQ